MGKAEGHGECACEEEEEIIRRGRFRELRQHISKPGGGGAASARNPVKWTLTSAARWWLKPSERWLTTSLNLFPTLIFSLHQVRVISRALTRPYTVSRRSGHVLTSLNCFRSLLLARLSRCLPNHGVRDYFTIRSSLRDDVRVADQHCSLRPMYRLTDRVCSQQVDTKASSHYALCTRLYPQPQARPAFHKMKNVHQRPGICVHPPAGASTIPSASIQIQREPLPLLLIGQSTDLHQGRQHQGQELELVHFPIRRHQHGRAMSRESTLSLTFLLALTPTWTQSYKMMIATFSAQRTVSLPQIGELCVRGASEMRVQTLSSRPHLPAAASQPRRCACW